MAQERRTFSLLSLTNILFIEVCSLANISSLQPTVRSTLAPVPSDLAHVPPVLAHVCLVLVPVPYSSCFCSLSSCFCSSSSCFCSFSSRSCSSSSCFCSSSSCSCSSTSCSCSSCSYSYSSREKDGEGAEHPNNKQLPAKRLAWAGLSVVYNLDIFPAKVNTKLWHKNIVFEHICVLL